MRTRSPLHKGLRMEGEGGRLGTYWRLRHEHRVQVWLRLDVLVVGVVQDGLEAVPVFNWGGGEHAQ